MGPLFSHQGSASQEARRPSAHQTGRGVGRWHQGAVSPAEPSSSRGDNACSCIKDLPVPAPLMPLWGVWSFPDALWPIPPRSPRGNCLSINNSSRNSIMMSVGDGRGGHGRSCKWWGDTYPLPLARHCPEHFPSVQDISCIPSCKVGPTWIHLVRWGNQGTERLKGCSVSHSPCLAEVDFEFRPLDSSAHSESLSVAASLTLRASSNVGKRHCSAWPGFINLN